jgi:hypothetical protein
MVWDRSRAKGEVTEGHARTFGPYRTELKRGHNNRVFHAAPADRSDPPNFRSNRLCFSNV